MAKNNQTLTIFNFNYPTISLSKNVKVGTFFTGIGSPEMAFKRLKENKVINDYEIMFFSEIDKWAIKSYCAIHNETPNKNAGDITKIDPTTLPYCDIWIGGFPCQDISMAGNQKGFDLNSNTRSSLGWKMIHFLNEVKEKPKVIIFENVAAITNTNMQKTLSLFKSDLEDQGYTLYDNVLNALDYNVPQNRERYFLVAILDNALYEFPSHEKLKMKLKDLLTYPVENKYMLSNKMFFDVDKFINNKRISNNNKVICTNIKNRKIKYKIDINRFIDGKACCGRDLYSNYNQTSRLWSINGYAPTLTANSISDTCKIVDYDNKYFFIRKISPLEAWRIMSFKDEDYYKAKNIGISDQQLYKQAGNSIATNVIYNILKKMF